MSTLPPTVAPPRGHGHGERPSLDLGRLLLGLAVLALGVLYLLDAAGTLDAGRAIDRWWPLLFVAAGVLTLLERPPSRVRGTVFVLVGVVLLGFSTGTLTDQDWDYVWPAAVIAAGLAILWRWRGRPIGGTAIGDDVLRSTAVFGGTKLRSDSQAFRGAWLTAIFGGVTLDLRGARPAPGGATVNTTSAFGGVTLLVPRGWRITTRCVPIFGGAEDKTEHEALADDAPVLSVDAVSLFGGVDIKHEP
ncbi:MAG: hypothetical protein HZB46_10675 [Solirubrobacterales bacterium]|nr:hypothetical protein [Solirubrobacterales bacterium]